MLTMVSYRLFKVWIALSTRYPADKFIRGWVVRINFYSKDNLKKKKKKKKRPVDSYILFGVTCPTNQRRRKGGIFSRQLDT